MNRTTRPGGITILVIVYLLYGLLMLIWSGLVFSVGGLASLTTGFIGADSLAALTGTYAWSGALGIVSAILHLVTAWGLDRLAKWAWYLAFIGAALSVVTGISGILSGGILTFACVGLGILIPLVIVIYLLRKEVRAAFGV